MKVRELVDRFEQFAPKEIAVKNDPVGLQIGSLDADIHKVMVTLDVRPEIVEEAIQNNVDFIFSHHPVMFHPAKNLDLSDPQNAMYAKIIQNNITVYSAHTNLDSANGGLNDWLADELELVNRSGLVPGKVMKIYRLTVQVPNVYANAVRMSLVDAGADMSSGPYTGYTYQSGGTLFYVPHTAADPTAGLAGEPTELEDSRLEFEVPESNMKKVLKTLKDVHPFEEPIYNIIELVDNQSRVSMGRVGELEKTKTLTEFIEYCKKVFKIDGLRVIANDLNKPIKKVAILGGDGGKYYNLAKHKNADVYITGDVYYHTAHEMLAADMPVIDPGHHIESICKINLVGMFTHWANQNDWDIDIIKSEINTDPFKFM